MMQTVILFRSLYLNDKLYFKSVCHILSFIHYNSQESVDKYTLRLNSFTADIRGFGSIPVVT